MNPRKLVRELKEKVEYIPIQDKIKGVHYVLFAKYFSSRLGEDNITLMSLEEIRKIVVKEIANTDL